MVVLIALLWGCWRRGGCCPQTRICARKSGEGKHIANMSAGGNIERDDSKVWQANGKTEQANKRKNHERTVPAPGLTNVPSFSWATVVTSLFVDRFQNKAHGYKYTHTDTIAYKRKVGHTHTHTHTHTQTHMRAYTRAQAAKLHDCSSSPFKQLLRVIFQKLLERLEHRVAVFVQRKPKRVSHACYSDSSISIHTHTRSPPGPS